VTELNLKKIKPEVHSNGKVYNFDRVIVTTSPEIFGKMNVPLPEEYSEKLSK